MLDVSSMSTDLRRPIKTQYQSYSRISVPPDEPHTTQLTVGVDQSGRPDQWCGILCREAVRITLFKLKISNLHLLFMDACFRL